MTLPAALFYDGRRVAFLALIAAACGDAGIANRADTSHSAAGARSAMPLPVEGVKVSLVVPDTAAPGGLVPIAIRLTNTTASPVELYLRGRVITFDIVITDAAGNDVWRLLQGEPVLAILQLRTLGAGETLNLTHEWDQRTLRGTRAAEGTYTVRGEILTDGSSSLVSDVARLVVLPAASR